MKVKKRDGRIEEFDFRKIERAVERAAKAAGQDSHDPEAGWEVCVGEHWKYDDERSDSSDYLTVDKIHEYVERTLMLDNCYEIAKAYIVYRAHRDEARKTRLKFDNSALADFIHQSKYARYQENLGRREVFAETVDRVRWMHQLRFGEIPGMKDIIDDAFGYVHARKVMPSMRSMQFAGPGIAAHNARMFNCSFTLIDRPRAFAEIFYLLLCGCGVGFSIQKHHVKKLPPIGRVDENFVIHHTINDDIEGWANAVYTLFDSYINGVHVEFNYSNIRFLGSPLKTTGGVAPGHLPLKRALESIRGILHGAQGRHLKPIECHDTICHTALAVMAGGIRRSSLISLFSLSDEEMMTAKTPENYDFVTRNPQRAMANNSAVLYRDKVTREDFDRIMDLNLSSYGDPGFFFSNGVNYGTNPCGEIGLDPVLQLSQCLACDGLGCKECLGCGVNGEQTGFSFCNLTETNVARAENEEDFYKMVQASATIGTLQAAYTDMPYLGPITEKICKRDALLGVGLTGIMDNPNLVLDPDILDTAAELAIRTNEEIAAKIGIRRARRVTCVKPNGNGSLALGGVGSGIHPHHARRYFRRITMGRHEPILKYFASLNPHMIEEKPGSNDVFVVFPIEAPSNAHTLKTLSASEFLDNVFLVYDYWIKTGSRTSDLTHNVSCTVSFDQSELAMIRDKVWANRERVAAMTFLPRGSDKIIPFCPREEVRSLADEARWNELISKFKPVDWTKMSEAHDATNLLGEAACVGGSCEI